MPRASSPRRCPPAGAGRLAPDRRAGRRAAADHPRRQRRRAGNRADRRQARLRDGAHLAGSGQLTAFQLRGDALAPWRADTTLTVTLTATTGFVLLILGFAFHWQATRAREADAIYDTVRSRIDTALNRGRCGLWDWDLARGRIFWSHSMFAILGFAPRDDLLTFGEVSRARASRRHQSSTRSRPSSPTPRPARSTTSSACCTPAANGSGCAPAASWCGSPATPGMHLIGIAVDITEQKTLVERTAAADIRLRDAIETIPEAFVLWDHENRLVLCNSNFQQLHNLPDDAIVAGHRLRGRGGRRPQARHPLQACERRPGHARRAAPSRRSSTTATGCRSASAAPRTAATSRSAPTSPRSSSTRRSWSTASGG